MVQTISKRFGIKPKPDRNFSYDDDIDYDAMDKGADPSFLPDSRSDSVFRSSPGASLGQQYQQHQRPGGRNNNAKFNRDGKPINNPKFQFNNGNRKGKGKGKGKSNNPNSSANGSEGKGKGKGRSKGKGKGKGRANLKGKGKGKAKGRSKGKGKSSGKKK